MQIEVIIFIIYIIFLITISAIAAYSYSKDKNSYMKVTCKIILNTIQCLDEDFSNIEQEIEQIYIGYSNIIPAVKKVYPNVVVWIDDIVYRINADYRYTRQLKQYINEVKLARENLHRKYPFAEYERYQQQILVDLKKIEESDKTNKIIIDNIINRIKDEFLKLNLEVNKKNKINVISLIITVISIIVTVISFFI